MLRYLGLDLHKEYVHGYEWTPGKGKGRHFRFPNTPQSWECFISQHIDSDCTVALEVTGNALQVYDWLQPHAGQVLLANPVELKRLGSGRHTDRVDAERLAKMAALGTIPAIWVPPQPVRQMRSLVAHRDQLVRQRTRLQNQAKAVLRRNGYSLKRNSDVREWLSQQHGKVHLPNGEWAILAGTVRLLTAVDEEIERVEAEIAAQAQDVPGVRLLLSLTGVGLVAAAVIWARIGDPVRFPNGKAVTRYAGLDPSVYQSGEQDRRGRISKNGDGLLRRILVQAAYQVARHDTGALGDFFRRKQKQIGTKRAIIALARKLLVVAWKILLTNTPYRSVRTERYQEKLGELKCLALKKSKLSPDEFSPGEDWVAQPGYQSQRTSCLRFIIQTHVPY